MTLLHSHRKPESVLLRPDVAAEFPHIAAIHAHHVQDEAGEKWTAAVRLQPPVPKARLAPRRGATMPSTR